MNINEYNKKKNNTTSNRKTQQNTHQNMQLNIPGDNKLESNNLFQKRKKKKKIRIDKIIGFITIMTIILFATIIYSDVKGTAKASNVQASNAHANNTQENLAIKSSESSNSATTETKPTGSDKSNSKIVCIDAGHGGTDGGAQYNGYSEKEQTLEIAKLVQKELESQGITVIMTRTSDDTVSLEKRMEIARTANAGTFISIHRNYYDTSSAVNGVEAWIHSSAPADANSLARDILTQLKKISGVNSRGVKSGTMTNVNTNYYLNSDSPCTSCIIELGFITNTTDNVLVTTNKNQCAKSIAQGIINYINELEK